MASRIRRLLAKALPTGVPKRLRRPQNVLKVLSREGLHALSINPREAMAPKKRLRERTPKSGPIRNRLKQKCRSLPLWWEP
jgi:hypothetical protein